MKREPPILADLVFLGGGHAQIAAIKSFAMNPVPGLRLTIVTANIRTPYSGMLPAYIEGVWDDDDLHIDLAHLAQFSGARLIVAACTGIDADGQKLLFDDLQRRGLDQERRSQSVQAADEGGDSWSDLL